MRRRAGWVVGVVVGTALLAGCSDAEGDADPGGDASSPGGGASSESSGPTETAEVPVVPELPAEALGDDDAAAVAFVEHWVDLVNYAFETGDIEPARELSSDCSVCLAVLDPVADGNTGQPEWRAANPEVLPPQPDDAGTTARVVIMDVASGADNGEFIFGLARSGADWRMSWLDGRE